MRNTLIQALLRVILIAAALVTVNVIAQVSNVEGLTPLEGVPIKRQTNIDSSEIQREEKFWEDAKSAGNKKAYEAYIKKYPKGRYLDLANAHIDRLSVQEIKPKERKILLNQNNTGRFEKNYFQIEKELMTNITGSKRVMVVQIAVMTHYDTRVFDNIKKHEFALRSVMLDLMRQTTEAQVSKPEFRKELAVKLKDTMNAFLEEYEDFGGIEELMFTSFVMQ